MLLINRLFQRTTRHSRSHRTRRREWFSPFGIQAAQVQVLENRRLLSALTVTTTPTAGLRTGPMLAARSTGSEDGGLRDVKTIRAGRESSGESLDFGLDNGVHLTASGGSSSQAFAYGMPESQRHLHTTIFRFISSDSHRR
jgi:hypothetical protein